MKRSKKCRLDGSMTPRICGSTDPRSMGPTVPRKVPCNESTGNIVTTRRMGFTARRELPLTERDSTEPARASTTNATFVGIRARGGAAIVCSHAEAINHDNEGGWHLRT